MKTNILTILVAISIAAILWSGIKSCNPSAIKVSKMKVGQVWTYTYDEDNPYRKPKTYYNKIIDMKEDYVLYIENYKDTLNCSKSSFVYDAELCDTCK